MEVPAPPAILACKSIIVKSEILMRVYLLPNYLTAEKFLYKCCIFTVCYCVKAITGRWRWVLAFLESRIQTQDAFQDSPFVRCGGAVWSCSHSFTSARKLSILLPFPAGKDPRFEYLKKPSNGVIVGLSIAALGIGAAYGQMKYHFDKTLADEIRAEK
jgi:hypothetical protein